MKNVLKIATILMCAFPMGKAFAGPFKDSNAAYVDEHIFPRTKAFASEAFQLKDLTVRACRMSGPQQKAILEKAFHEVVDTWQSVQHIRTGPLSDYDQLHRLQFWPDKRNKVGKALIGLEKKQQEVEWISEKIITSGSVAAQGFPIYERILYQDQISDKNCEILKAVSANIASIARSVHKAWIDPEYGYGGEMKFTLAENELYTDELSVTADLFTNLWSALQWVEDIKLRAPLREEASKAKPRRMENWRAARSFKNISLNIAALKESYEIFLQSHAKGITEGEKRDQAIVGNLDAAANIIKDLEKVSEERIKDQVIWDKVLQSAVHLKEARGQLFAVAKELGIPVGFNSLDGD